MGIPFEKLQIVFSGSSTWRKGSLGGTGGEKVVNESAGRELRVEERFWYRCVKISER